MFYIFRVIHLNIYYVIGIAIAVSFLISFLFSKNEPLNVNSDERGTALSFDSLQTTTSKSESHNSIYEEVVSSKKTKTVSNKSYKVEEIKEVISSKNTEIENTILNKTNQSIEESAHSLPKDSTALNKQFISKPEMKNIIPVPPKVVYMYKRDTVFTYDTVSVKKKKNKKN